MTGAEAREQVAGGAALPWGRKRGRWKLLLDAEITISRATDTRRSSKKDADTSFKKCLYDILGILQNIDTSPTFNKDT
ncbi:MAG: hypothetical protein AAGK05_19535, partial [Pseudomonadota bacterium]